MSPAEVLERAAEYIEEHGWIQDPCSAQGPQCVGNAIAFVNKPQYRAQEMFWRYLGLSSIADVWAWNDTPGRTAEEVCRTLREVAASLTEQTIEDPALDQLGEDIQEVEVLAHA